MKEYGFGIVGCGMISAFHAQAIAELPNAELVAVSSRNEGNRRKLTEKYDCDGVADYNALVARDDVDLVCICTPSGAHLEPAQSAARAGKHVVVEKPIEVTLERADALIRACDENHVRLCSIYPYRFTEAAIVLKDAVDAGRFGRITVGDCYNKWFRTQEYYDSGAWRGTWRLDGGGACMNQGIHAIDLIQWYMGPVDTVYALTDCLAHERIEVEDTAVAALRYKSGAMGVIECTTSIHPGFARKIEIHGDKGTVVMENERVATWDFAEERPEDAGIRDRLNARKMADMAGVADPGTISYVNFRELFKDFLNALDTGGDPVADGHEGRKALEIIMAIYHSARTGAPVQLPYKPLQEEHLLT